MSILFQTDAVIAASGTTSGAVECPSGYNLVGMFAPVCTGTALTLTMAKALAGTYVAQKTAADAAITLTISGTAHYIALDPLLFQGLQFIKLVSGSTEAAERTFTLVFRKGA